MVCAKTRTLRVRTNACDFKNRTKSIFFFFEETVLTRCLGPADTTNADGDVRAS